MAPKKLRIAVLLSGGGTSLENLFTEIDAGLPAEIVCVISSKKSAFGVQRAEKHGVPAIAIPRLSRGSEGAADAALIGNLAVMRSSIDLFSTEHPGFPPLLATFESQMLDYSDPVGNTSSVKGGGFIYGPYLRAIPPLPVGAMRGMVGIKGPPADGAGAEGWIYDEATQQIIANTAGGESDVNGKLYSTY